MNKPIVAIIGRPNVGKSTLFNRIARKRMAVVHDQPGVTRDRLYAECSIRDRHFLLIDTGGLETKIEKGECLRQKVAEQALYAIEEADIIMFVMDIKAGYIPLDIEICRMLQKTEKSVIYVLNKADRPSDTTKGAEFYEMGIDRVYDVSAQHKLGLYEMEEALLEKLPTKGSFGEHASQKDLTRLAIIGRPNVGKSSIVNAFTGNERMVVTDIPGTTRDPVDTEIRYHGRSYILIDTAGIRRRGKIAKVLEKDCVLKARESLKRSQIAAIIIDGKEGISKQDVHIAGMAADSGLGCIVVVNKWDMVEKDTNTSKKYEEIKQFQMKFLGFAPILFVSAITRQRLFKILEMADKIRRNWEKHIDTPKLNDALKRWTVEHSIPLYMARPLKIYFISQVRDGPPTFILFMNRPEGLHFSYERYLVNRIRDTFGFEGCPIRLIAREREVAKGRQRRDGKS